MSTKNECVCEVNLFVIYVLDLSVFSQNTPHSAAVRVRCVHLGLRVCACVIIHILRRINAELPQGFTQVW